MDRLQANDPDFLGKWKITSRIAESGNAVIYLGHSGIEGAQEAAIKVIKEEWKASSDAISRLKIEAEALTKLKNENIAKLIDFNFDSDPIWIATEYLGRSTLDVKLKQDQQPITGLKWWHLAENLFHALNAAHAMGIIHKDIKPSNIIIADGSAKIIDFGISYVPGNTQFSNNIEFEGSRLFAAPENYTRKDSPKMDVFSAAATLAYAAKSQSIWNDIDESSLRNSVMRAQPNFEGLDQDQIDFLYPLLDKFPSKRPSSQQALEKAREIIAYKINDSEGDRPIPLKGSSKLYRAVMSKYFRVASVLVVAVGIGFVANQPSQKIVYKTLFQEQISSSPTPSASTLDVTQQSSSAVCEDKFTKNDPAALEVCIVPATAGDLRSIYYVGKLQDDNGNTAEAEKWYLKGAKLDDVSSMRSFVQLLINQKKETSEEYRKWVKICADFGDPKCLLYYGLELLNENQNSKGMQLIKESALAGNGRASWYLGMQYWNQKDLKNALYWLQKSAEADDPDGLLNVLKLAYNTNNDDVYLKWLLDASNKKNEKYIWMLAAYYVEKNNNQEAIKWAKIGAELGEVNAEGLYGILLYSDAKNTDLAKSYLLKAANKKDVKAMNFLGDILRDQKNLEEALTWYLKSAALDDLDGINWAATIYAGYYGDGQNACKLFNTGLAKTRSKFKLATIKEPEATAWISKFEEGISITCK
jgi:serine/threonine protein kinase